VFANGTVKLTNKSRLRASCGDGFINQWSECNDKRTLVDPYQYGYVPNTKNREYCAKWREANYEKWTAINRANALKKREVKPIKEINTPPPLIAEIMSFL